MWGFLTWVIWAYAEGRSDSRPKVGAWEYPTILPELKHPLQNLS